MRPGAHGSATVALGPRPRLLAALSAIVSVGLLEFVLLPSAAAKPPATPPASNAPASAKVPGTPAGKAPAGPNAKAPAAGTGGKAASAKPRAGAPKPKKARPAKPRIGGKKRAAVRKVGGARSAGKSQVSFDPGWASSPAARYGALSADACFKELQRRSIEHDVVRKAAGVLAPVRLKAGVGGVVFRTEAPEKTRRTSPFEVFDCRLVLALADWVPTLKDAGIEEVHMFSAWRPPAAGFPHGGHAKRHPGALAIDVYRFVKKAEPGKAPGKLEIEHDWAGAIGETTCGDRAKAPAGEPAKELRKLVCAAADKRLFNSILTPNYDRAHFNHLHLEVTPEVSWQLVQ